MISPMTPTFEPSGRVTWAVWMTSTPALRQAAASLLTRATIAGTGGGLVYV